MGKCFTIQNNLEYAEKIKQTCDHGDDPTNDNYKDIKDATCLEGFSGAMLTNGGFQTYVMGLPGRKLDGSMSVFNVPVEPDTTFYTTWADGKDESRPKDRTGQNFGYAVAVGTFTTKNREEFVASSYRTGNLQGKVVAFGIPSARVNSLVKRFTLPLPKDPKFQMGSNFGQSLCAVDLNNDGFSDMLVGAPYHRHEKFGDEGRVYVYMNNQKTPLNHMPELTLDGPKEKGSLFGFAMAVAGDLNKDGYPEVAISAPYGGNDRGGVVYIYFATKDGIETSPRQIIEASQFSSGTKTFGYSLAGNLDVDNNGYPDLAIGAYSSDHAFLLRSRPIVDMQSQIILSTTDIALEDNSSLQLASDGVFHQSINITVCLKFENLLSNPSFGSANVTYTIELERDKDSDPYRRMFFLDGKIVFFAITQQVTLAKENKSFCEFNHTVYLRKKDKILDVIAPLTFDLTYDLVHSPSCKLCPILNNYHDPDQRSRRKEANFVKQCGPDKVCEPDLSVTGEIKTFGVHGDEHKELHVGDDDQMTVSVTVINKAQDAAYSGKVIVTFPSIIYYASSGQDVRCSKVQEDERSVNADETKVDCRLPNPLHKNSKFDIKFDTTRVTGNVSELAIHLEATSPSKDPDPSDNKYTVKVAVKFEADLSVEGLSIPDQVAYSEKTIEVKNLIDVGPSVKKVITVKNNGPSPVDYAEVTILVPIKNKTLEAPNYVLYLVDLQVLENAGRCNVKTNPLNLKDGNNSTLPNQGQSVSSGGKPAAITEELPCEYDSSLTCLEIPCYLERMKRGDQVQIQVTSRVWESTLVKAKVDSVNITTTAKVTPSSSVPEMKKDNNVHKIQLVAKLASHVTEKGTAVWIYIVSVLGGLALLALVGLALHKCGFFKRNRVEKPEHTEEELEPMRAGPSTA
ncbi:integrin alpha-8-like isoform X1 [Porites lutea]|uniref:integrin alpha-8-like isoform X1 n=1 Tax=Porites lutea TaxID=51062 RepID=UPI003CC56D44